MGPARGMAQGAAAGSAFGPLGTIAGGLLGPVIGGLFGRSGQDAANQMNYQIAKENRAWQERMSNTAYQRAAADLQKAGLNRILAIGQPSSTPAGNVATMQNKNALLAEGIKQGTIQALAAKRLNAEIKNINARTSLTQAQRNAIQPAAQVGEGVENVVNMSKGPYRAIVDRTSRLIDEVDYGNMFETTANMAKQNVANASAAVRRAAQSVGLNPQKAERELLKILDRMDLPGGMTKAEKLNWARRNPEKIRSYMERQYK